MTEGAENWSITKAEEEYIHPLYPSKKGHEVGGRTIIAKGFDDETEVDGLKNDLLAIPLFSEKLRGFFEEMLEYLSWPRTYDGFDKDAEGNPVTTEEAHRLRREWELTLTAEEKWKLDKTAFSGGQMRTILSIFTNLREMAEEPILRQLVTDDQGNVPPVIAVLEERSKKFEARLNEYQTYALPEREALIYEFRSFLKDAVRELLNAYRAPAAQEWLLDS